MKTLKALVLISILSLGSNVFGQDNSSFKEMIAKIDSVSNANSIKYGRVKILNVTNSFEKTTTRDKSLTEASEFHFDGQFLVIENKYFNLNKMLYFYIEDDVIEFFFQGY